MSGHSILSSLRDYPQEVKLPLIPRPNFPSFVTNLSRSGSGGEADSDHYRRPPASNATMWGINESSGNPSRKENERPLTGGEPWSSLWNLQAALHWRVSFPGSSASFPLSQTLLLSASRKLSLSESGPHFSFRSPGCSEPLHPWHGADQRARKA